MSVEYDIYLEQHIANVNKAAEWMADRFEDVAVALRIPNRAMIFPDHDKSKYDPEEYKAYDAYFYGRNRSYDVVQKFNYAWLRHIHLNPHHWQYWVLQHDDEPEETLEMPYDYVVEMICDWWSFSFAKGNLMEIFDWYEQHKDMMLHENTRKLAEDFLKRIREELEKDGYSENGTLTHHGIIGQKWGVRNGPPYPLSSEKLASKIFHEAKQRVQSIADNVIQSIHEAGGEAYGLEHKLKTQGSIQRKIDTDSKEKGISVSDAASSIKDAVRFTMISPDDRFVSNYNAFKKSMSEKGYTETTCKNYWQAYQQGKVKHKSVTSVFSTEDDYPFEVQFQTPSSQKVKDAKTPIYEERRRPGLSEKRKAELEEAMTKLAESIPTPKDIYTIHSH